MKYILMNKNTPIALIEYDTNYNEIKNIYEIYNIDYAPLSIITANKDKLEDLVQVMNKWFKGRGIPSWRKDIENLLEKLNVTAPEELLNKAYALSLSDQYWIKEEKSSIKWNDINFFENDFKYKGYLEASLSAESSEKTDLHSPNNTTDGMLQKGWIIENGKRVLVKGIYQPSREEPINEWLASNICKRLNFEYCNYSIDIVNNKIVSKCDNYITSDEEIISAYDVLNSKPKSNNINDFEHYIQILQEHNIPNARRNVEDMFIIDFLMMNFDRHLKNFRIIRNVNTLEWTRTTPIFDTGESMQCDKLTGEINFSNGTGKFFTNTNKKFSEMLSNIKDISRIDISALDGLVDDYKSILLKYQPFTDSSLDRIDKLCNGLQIRIEKLKEFMK